MERNSVCFRFAFLVLCFSAGCVFGASAGEEGPVRNDPRHDPLPPRFAALNRYDRIALEPYREKYDTMPLHEKARVYGQAFEFMNNRKPRFAPALAERIRQSEEIANSRNAYDAKKFMYRPAERRRAPTRDEKILSGIPAPWAKDEPPAEAAPQDEDDYRMESLRPGSLLLNPQER